ncbi:hypothetical protein [Subtercola sp. YIM 133946]|uniref:hypothetical protein n=1 Tax=Subtercola sp. YIM 133946 TaxID=3118909 RepID=UPI002F92EA22
MGDELLVGVEKWLEKSGHAFELRIARAFRKGGANTADLSFSYTDATTGVLREGDVLAQYGWTAIENIRASIEVVVECKSGRDHPWVAFYDEDSALGATIYDWAYFAHGPFVGITEPLTEAWGGQPPFDAKQVASHLVAAHAGDSRNPAGDAVRQVLSAAAALQQRYIEGQMQDRRGCVVVPVVVTGGQLVECRLKEDGSTHLNEVPLVVVAGPRRERPTPVFVVTEEHAPQLASTFSIWRHLQTT